MTTYPAYQFTHLAEHAPGSKKAVAKKAAPHKKGAGKAEANAAVDEGGNKEDKKD